MHGLENIGSSIRDQFLVVFVSPVVAWLLPLFVESPDFLHVFPPTQLRQTRLPSCWSSRSPSRMCTSRTRISRSPSPPTFLRVNGLYRTRTRRSKASPASPRHSDRCRMPQPQSWCRRLLRLCFRGRLTRQSSLTVFVSSCSMSVACFSWRERLATLRSRQADWIVQGTRASWSSICSTACWRLPVYVRVLSPQAAPCKLCSSVSLRIWADRWS